MTNEADTTRAHFGVPPALGIVTLIDSRKVEPIMIRGVPSFGPSPPEDSPTDFAGGSMNKDAIESLLARVKASDLHMREEVHYNGGAKFFAYLYRCVERPRLSRYDYYDRSTKGVTSTFRVDGQDQPDLETALTVLTIGPVYSSDELAVLATVSDEPEDRRKEMIANYAPWAGLKEKGAIQWAKGRVARTAAGLAALLSEKKP